MLQSLPYRAGQLPTRPILHPPMISSPLRANSFPSSNAVFPQRLILRQPNEASTLRHLLGYSLNAMGSSSNSSQQTSSSSSYPFTSPHQSYSNSKVPSSVASSSNSSATSSIPKKREHSQSSDQPEKKRKTDFKVAIIDQNARNGFICDQVWALFRRRMGEALLKHISKYPNYTDPVFFYVGLENDRRWYQCEDEASLTFLKTTVSEIGSLSQNVKLKVDTFKNIYERCKAEISINNPSLTAYEVTSIILSANPRLARSDILISSHKTNPNDQILILDMTSDVADFLRNQKSSTIYFGFQQIQVRFLPSEIEIIL